MSLEPTLAFMQALAQGLDGTLNPGATGTDRKMGFTLLVFEMDAYDGGRVNYVSNAQRDDMLSAMKEFIARAEGRYAAEGGHA